MQKKIISLFLIGALCFSMAFSSQAANINETKKKGQKLEEQKKQAEQEKKSLASDLNGILGDMAAMEEKINKKEEEITKKEDELIAAQANENDQYESMKKRIKYMYENGNGQFIEVLLEAENLSDFLNKTEYISTISEYDRDMLKQYQKIVKEVEKQQAVLKEEKKEMETMQNDLIAKQDSVETLLATKSDEIASLKNEIHANDKQLKKLEAAAKAAAEAARKKAEAEATAREAAGGGGSAGESVVSGNGQFTHPCPGYKRISSPFGYRDAPLAGASTNHKGIDFAAATGTPIYAAASGTVISSGYSGNAGKMIVINHGNGLWTYYMHCNKLFVSAGQKVSKGQNIAAVGTTGNSTGPHLHFQVNRNGVPTNPMNYL